MKEPLPKKKQKKSAPRSERSAPEKVYRRHPEMGSMEREVGRRQGGWETERGGEHFGDQADRHDFFGRSYRGPYGGDHPGYGWTLGGHNPGEQRLENQEYQDALDYALQAVANKKAFGKGSWHRDYPVARRGYDERQQAVAEGLYYPHENDIWGGRDPLVGVGRNSPDRKNSVGSDRVAYDEGGARQAARDDVNRDRQWVRRQMLAEMALGGDFDELGLLERFNPFG